MLTNTIACFSPSPVWPPVCSISFGPVIFEISLIEAAVEVTYHKT
jgi:hypothetical protein